MSSAADRRRMASAARRSTAIAAMALLATVGCARSTVTKAEVTDAVVEIGVDRPLATCVVDSLSQDELDEFGTDGDKLSQPLRAKVTRLATDCGRKLSTTTTAPVPLQP